MDKIKIGLLVWALAATVALAWLAGRVSTDQKISATTQQTGVLKSSEFAPSASPTLSASPTPDTTLVPTYPKYVSSVPKVFLGRWDEIISDKCDGREARYYFTEKTFMEFEVEWEVTRVKLYSPTEIDISTTLYDEDKNQINEVWSFKISDDGRTLTGRNKGSDFFKRCPFLQ